MAASRSLCAKALKQDADLRMEAPVLAHLNAEHEKRISIKPASEL
jgi:hypothetical protein